MCASWLDPSLNEPSVEDILKQKVYMAFTETGFCLVLLIYLGLHTLYIADQGRALPSFWSTLPFSLPRKFYSSLRTSFSLLS
jgi:hypothetical protein